MLHFWAIADSEGQTPEECLQWIDEQETSLKECHRELFPSLSFDRHCHRIPPSTGSNIRDAYHEIADTLSEEIEKAKSTDRFVAVLDARRKRSFDKIQSLESVQGLLILAFPEILWVPVLNEDTKETKTTVKKALNLAAGGFNPLFDGTGVRGALIKQRQTNSAYPYYRDDVAVTIDEECHFAELTAYTAFRFGYRACPISTARLAKQILCFNSKMELPSFDGVGVSSDTSIVVFEDGDIQFPDCDQVENNSFSFGRKRDDTWPLLKEASLRVLTTAFSESEKIANGRTVTAKKWFCDTGVKALCSRGKDKVRVVLEKLHRRMFNIFAGGMGDVWVWDVIKGMVIVGILIPILFHRPFLFVPALFLVFVAFGLLREAFAGCFSFLFGHHVRIRTFFKVRSQWRFYPRLYANHCPRKQIQREGERRWCFVRKPLGGIFGLRNQCMLPNGRGFGGQLDAGTVKKSYQNVLKGRAPTRTGESVEDSSHSAYGMTLDVATGLIGRARAMKDKGDGIGIEGAIHAAVLATCAYELLGHKTPALSVEALALRHYFEVFAECEFPGVRASLDMEDRLVDIHNSMSQICRASNGDIREEMFESGMAAICDSLSELLRSRGRNEEAAFLSRQSRHMHRLLLSPFLRNLLAFPEWAVRSKLNFITSLSIFLGTFALYYMFEIDSSAGMSDVLAKMYELLFSTQPNMDLTEIMVTANSGCAKSVVDISKSLQVVTLEIEPGLRERIASATVVVQAMRQLALIHIGFLTALFYDFMHRK